MKMLKVSEIIYAMIRDHYGTLFIDYSNKPQTDEYTLAPDYTQRAVWKVINRFSDRTKSTLQIYYEAFEYARSTGD
jgi:hypothetical protein